MSISSLEQDFLNACFYNNIGRVEQFILSQQITNLNFENEFGRYPLWYAAVNQYFELTHLLIEYGADANWAGKNSKHLLYGIKDSETFCFLKEKGLNIYFEEMTKYSPLFNYMKQKNIVLVEQVIQSGVAYHHLDLNALDQPIREQIKQIIFIYEAQCEKQQLENSIHPTLKNSFLNNIKTKL